MSLAHELLIRNAVSRSPPSSTSTGVVFGSISAEAVEIRIEDSANMTPIFHNRFPLAVGGPASLETLLGQVFGEDGGRGALDAWAFGALPFSMWEDEDQVHIEVDLPGVELKDLEVSIHDDVLTIKAERRVEEGRKFRCNGRRFGRFERSLELPESVAAEAVDARLAAGVLHLSLPKRPEARVTKVNVRDGG
jgi:HSP20 family protein